MPRVGHRSIGSERARFGEANESGRTTKLPAPTPVARGSPGPNPLRPLTSGGCSSNGLGYRNAFRYGPLERMGQKCVGHKGNAANLERR
jgi:hypothetical protein